MKKMASQIFFSCETSCICFKITLVCYSDTNIGDNTTAFSIETFLITLPMLKLWLNKLGVSQTVVACCIHLSFLNIVIRRDEETETTSN